MKQQIIKTSEIKESNTDTKPEFYKNLSGGSDINITDGGGIVNSTIIPIIKKMTGISEGGTEENPVIEKIYHGLGKRCFIFMRYHPKEDDVWQDIWIIHKNFYTTENYIYITADEDMKFEIYFTNDSI